MALAATEIAALRGVADPNGLIYQQVFDLSALAADADADTAPIAHVLGAAPTEWKIVDMGVATAASNHTCWMIHTLTANSFIVRRVTVTGTGSTAARLWLRLGHTIVTGAATM